MSAQTSPSSTTNPPPPPSSTPTPNAQISTPDSHAYWSSIPPTVNGMLGGYPQISRIDLQGSYLFFQKVRRLYPGPPPSSKPYPQPSSAIRTPRPPPPELANGTHPSKGKNADKHKEKDTEKDTQVHEESLLPLPLALDIGAGIGRVTTGLLSRLCTTIDVVEPQAAFAAKVPLQKMCGAGRVGDVYVCGIEEWVPKDVERKGERGMEGGLDGKVEGKREGKAGGKREEKWEGEGERELKQYDLVWAQWCLGYLRDEALVTFLCKLSGHQRPSADEHAIPNPNPNPNNPGYLKKGGWIIVKENVSTTILEGKSGTVDVFDELDSSVTRSDATFRQCFREAGLRAVRSELQKGFEKGLLPVRFYALRVEEGG